MVKWHEGSRRTVKPAGVLADIKKSNLEGTCSYFNLSLLDIQGPRVIIRIDPDRIDHMIVPRE